MFSLSSQPFLQKTFVSAFYTYQLVSFPSLIADDGFNRNLEIQDLLCVGEQVADCFRQLMANPDTPQPVTDTHTTCLLDVVNLLTSCQMGFPRLFFQSLQVKMSSS